MIASVAAATGIPTADLEQSSTEMIATLVEILDKK